MGAGKPKKERKLLEKPVKPVILELFDMPKEKRVSLLKEMDMLAQRKPKAMTLKSRVESIKNVIDEKRDESNKKNREYRKSLSPFECTLNKVQMRVLLDFFNEYLLQEPITFEELDDVFMGEYKGATYHLRDWNLLILLFRGLTGEGFKDTDRCKPEFKELFQPIIGHQYICKKWQNVLSKLEEFEDKRGNLLTDERIAKQLSKMKNETTKLPENIDALIHLFEKIVELE